MSDDTIVVGIDGSERSNDALRWAVAGAGAATIEAVAVWQVPAIPPPFGMGDLGLDVATFEKAAGERAQKAVAAASAAMSPDADIKTRVVDGPPGPALVKVAAEREARLLVVGQRGHGGFAGLLLGSVSEYCLHRAEGPVAIVPEPGPAPSGRMVVGIDGSDASIAALRWAAAEAARRGVDLAALTCWTWLGQPFGGVDVTRAGSTELDARRVANHAIAQADVDAPIEVIARNDLAVPALLSASEAGDIVVVGAEGRTGMRGRLAGSVSRQLAHHASSPIVIVR